VGDREKNGAHWLWQRKNSCRCSKQQRSRLRRTRLPTGKLWEELDLWLWEEEKERTGPDELDENPGFRTMDMPYGGKEPLNVV